MTLRAETSITFSAKTNCTNNNERRCQCRWRQHVNNVSFPTPVAWFLLKDREFRAADTTFATNTNKHRRTIFITPISPRYKHLSVTGHHRLLDVLSCTKTATRQTRENIDLCAVNFERIFNRARDDSLTHSLAEPRFVWGYILPLFENMGLVICPNLHRNTEGGRNWKCASIQKRASKPLKTAGNCILANPNFIFLFWERHGPRVHGKLAHMALVKGVR